MPGPVSADQSNFFQHYFLGSSGLSESLSIPILIIAALLFMYYIGLPISRAVLDILDWRRLRNRKLVFLELTPPSYSTKTSLATSQLFVTIHGLLNSLPRHHRWLHHKRVLALELLSDRQNGIRFRAALVPEAVELFEQLVVAYLPEVQLARVPDYLTASLSNQDFRLLEFKQTNRFSHRLATHRNLLQHDPIAYIATALSKAASDQLTAIQFVLSPTPLRVVDKIRAQLRPLHFNDPAMSLGQFKLSEQLFNVNLRALVVGPDCEQRAQGLANVLYMFRRPGYQGLRVKPCRVFKLPRQKYRLVGFGQRLPAMLSHNTMVLGTSELASLYHFPYGKHIQVEDVVKSSFNSLPAPLAMKHHSDADDYDVILGINKHHGSETILGLTAAERERHVYVIGGTGSGKTTMLMYGLVQDMKSGKGVAVVDPHGDLAESLLKHVPKDRLKDVIYFNPVDLEAPIGLNLLELPNDLSDNQLALEQDFVTEAIVSLFRKTFSEDDSGGHRIEYILRNTIRTAYTVPQATLFTLYDLLTDPDFRKSVTQTLTDQRLKQFWQNEFGKAGRMQQVKMASGVTTKLGRYDSSAVVRGVIDQASSTIDFDNILDSGKILICNFAKGSIGEDTAELFGTAILTKLQLAALRRARIKQAERRPYYLYVDEFQHFATHSFLQMLSEARKYKLFLTMAEQSTAQQAEQRLVHIILDNVGTVVCFRVRAASEKLLLPIFQPRIKTGEIANLSAYHYFVKIAGLETHEPLSGETVLLNKPINSKMAQKVMAASRRKYATKNVASDQKKPPSEGNRSPNQPAFNKLSLEQDQQVVI